MKNLDVLLVNSPSPNPGSILSHRIQGLPPLGINYIATWLNKKGYSTQLLDFYIRTVTLKDLKQILETKKPALIGISTTTETFKNGIRLAEYIKKSAPNTIVVMGGCHVTFEYESALTSGVIDYIIRGEGEITFEKLCDSILQDQGSIEEINGLSYIHDNKIVSNPDRAFISDLDLLPFPDRELLDIDKYSHPGSISTSRGCPGRCIFCAATALSGGRYRMRSAENVVEEMIYLKGLGFNHIQFIDDTLTADIRRLKKILRIIEEKELIISWAAESRVDVIDKDLLLKMSKAGCKSLQFGVEAGNQKMLDSLKKNITIQQIRNVFKWCKEVGIAPASCLIIGQPFDTKESINDTINIGLELQALGARIVFSISTPYPGTFMYNNADKLGIKIINSDTDCYTTQTPVYNSKYLSATEIQNYFYDACILLAKKNGNNKMKDKYNELYNEAVKITQQTG